MGAPPSAHTSSGRLFLRSPPDYIDIIASKLPLGKVLSPLSANLTTMGCVVTAGA